MIHLALWIVSFCIVVWAAVVVGSLVLLAIGALLAGIVKLLETVCQVIGHLLAILVEPVCILIGRPYLTEAAHAAWSRDTRLVDGARRAVGLGARDLRGRAGRPLDPPGRR